MISTAFYYTLFHREALLSRRFVFPLPSFTCHCGDLLDFTWMLNRLLRERVPRATLESANLAAIWRIHSVCHVQPPFSCGRASIGFISYRIIAPFYFMPYFAFCLLSTYHGYLPCLYIPPSIRLSLSSWLINRYGSRRNFRVFTSLASFCVLVVSAFLAAMRGLS